MQANAMQAEHMDPDFSTINHVAPELPILGLAGVNVTFRQGSKVVRALQNVTIDFSKGRIIGLLGPNGSGKTTMLRVIAGLCVPDTGKVVWRTTGTGLPSSLSDIGVVLEGRGNLHERLSTLENARYYCGLKDRTFDRSVFDRLAESLEIADPFCPVRQLSTGLKLRCTLLMALIHRPSMLFLDEPTLGLDIFGRERLEWLLAETSQRDCTVFVSSHDLDFIEGICERVICLKSGQVVFDGPKSEFGLMHFMYRIDIQNDRSYETFFLRSHAELTAFLVRSQARIAQLESFQVTRLALKDKYAELMKNGPRPLP